MDIQEAYNLWAAQYDSDENKTRDAEHLAKVEILQTIKFDRVLELGCGTGKNTRWLLSKTKRIVAVDFSKYMLEKARKKIDDPKVLFVHADLRDDWQFAGEKFDLITFSLVLEHINDLGSIFKKASEALLPGGYMYIGELHPYKQYNGSKARFHTGKEEQQVPCFTHHVSEFTNQALVNGLEVLRINERFDTDDPAGFPRIIAILFRKKEASCCIPSAGSMLP
ncbi:MAG TPA: class I SAM-dependent methyltransferase [Bacteroidales bacterium]|nr:class I SAM-dependent methyltransferase [Bacteroidales bacterium]